MDITILFIIILLIIGGVVGYRRGATRELISLVGIFLVLILSFVLKNPISVFLYKHLPFFNFAGSIKGITVLNILLYEFIAFLVVFGLLYLILRLLLIFSNMFEKVIDTTILLGIPSKIIGSVLGVIEVYIYIFLVVLILKSPLFNNKYVNDSYICNKILETPILSKVSDKSVRVLNQILDLREEYKESDDRTEFNQKSLDIMIENKVITKDNAQILIDKGKLKGVVVK